MENIDKIYFFLRKLEQKEWVKPIFKKNSKELFQSQQKFLIQKYVYLGKCFNVDLPPFDFVIKSKGPYSLKLAEYCSQIRIQLDEFCNRSFKPVSKFDSLSSFIDKPNDGWNSLKNKDTSVLEPKIINAGNDISSFEKHLKINVFKNTMWRPTNHKHIWLELITTLHYFYSEGIRGEELCDCVRWVKPQYDAQAIKMVHDSVQQTLLA